MGEIEIRRLKQEDTQHAPAGPPVCVEAVDTTTNKVVGTLCAIPLYVTNASGERILTARLDDTLVDPDYREQNIFGNMYALVSDACRKMDIVALWGFTYTTGPFARLGFEVPFHCDFGFIVFDAIKGYKYLNGLKGNRTVPGKAKVAVLALASRLKYGIHIGFKTTEGYSISKEEQRSLEDLAPSEPGAFFLLQNSKFLEWRLRHNSSVINYLHYSLVNESGKRVGSVICSNTAEVTHIMHMIFARNLSDETKRHFLNAVIADLSERTAVLRCWGFMHNEAGREEIELLKSTGFVFTDQGMSFVWKKIDERSSLNVSNFVLSRMASQETLD